MPLFQLVDCQLEHTRRTQTLTEKCIRQRNSINALHCRILRKIRINEEENRHINRFPSIQLLLLKTETLNFAEVRSNLTRRHTVRRDTDNIRRALVSGRVEGKSSLSR